MEQLPESRVIHVEIHGQRYPIRSSLEGQYVAELAAFVDEKMRLAAKECPAGDTLKIAVLAALNVADAYFRSREADFDWNSSLEDRTRALERMVDLAIGLADPQSGADQSHLDAGLRLK